MLYLYNRGYREARTAVLLTLGITDPEISPKLLLLNSFCLLGGFKNFSGKIPYLTVFAFLTGAFL